MQNEFIEFKTYFMNVFFLICVVCNMLGVSNVYMYMYAFIAIFEILL